MQHDNQVIAPPGGVFPGIDAVGAYHLLRPLAMGGMARIWLAVDARDGRQVAVKRILDSVAADPELRTAFTDEGQLGLRLRHPNIVQTIEVGDAQTAHGPEPYLVLELLQGRSLIDVLRIAARHKRPVPLDFVVAAVCDAARGLSHAHRLCAPDGKPLGIVHRDVTPHNLFVCASGAIKVLDFGIAKAHAQQHKTRTGVIKGKFAYLSPEQIRGLVPDARVDVFALGIVLYELLTGRPLFRGANEAETLNRVLTLDVPPPEKLRPGLPPGLGAVALRALQRDRDRRLPSCAALADSLEAVAGAEGIVPSAAAVQAFVRELFPNDAQDHAEDSALVRRTYEHLSSASLRAMGSNPWLTPADGLPAKSDRSWGHRLSVLAGAIFVTAAAALATTTLLGRHPLPDGVPAAVIRAQPEAAPEPAPPPAELPDVAAPETLPSRGHARGHHASRGGQGQLRLAAQPWAAVTVDGRALGTTPLKPTPLPAGPHTIVLRNDDLNVTVKRRVTIQPDKESVLVVDLFSER